MAGTSEEARCRKDEEQMKKNDTPQGTTNNLRNTEGREEREAGWAGRQADRKTLAGKAGSGKTGDGVRGSRP